MDKYKTKDLNLAQWAIVLYLDQHSGSRRQDIAKDLNIHGSRIGYIIKQLKNKNIVTTKKNPNKLIDVYYYLI